MLPDDMGDSSLLGYVGGNVPTAKQWKMTSDNGIFQYSWSAQCWCYQLDLNLTMIGWKYCTSGRVQFT